VPYRVNIFFLSIALLIFTQLQLLFGLDVDALAGLVGPLPIFNIAQIFVAAQGQLIFDRGIVYGPAYLILAPWLTNPTFEQMADLY
jgi:hypothetical protein